MIAFGLVIFVFLLFLVRVELVIYFIFIFPPQDRVYLCGSGCPGARFVDQASLELTEILPLPPEC